MKATEGKQRRQPSLDRAKAAAIAVCARLRGQAASILLVVSAVTAGAWFWDDAGAGSVTTLPPTVHVESSGLDIVGDYYPPADGPGASPAVLLLHGWTSPTQSPAPQLRHHARAFQRGGFAVLAPNLRGWPPTGGVDDCGGTQVDDVLAMLGWLSARDDVDPDQVYLVGYSQGAQIALLASARGAPVRAVAGFAPVVDIASWADETDVPGIRDYAQEECGGPTGWPRRSALAAAEDLKHPLLLVHGDADTRVPTAQSQRLYRRLRELNRPVRLHLLSDVDHTMQDVLRPGLAMEFFRTLQALPSSAAVEGRR